MKNYVTPGVNITLPAPYDCVSGEGALIGAIFGVAQHDVAEGDPAVFCRGGVYELPKVSAQAWTEGALVYWDDTNRVCTTVATDNTLIGAAVAAAANPSGTGLVLTDGTIR